MPLIRALLAIIGLGSALNGIWMLVHSPLWFELIPAAMEDTGPLNNHLVHDVGVVYLLMGIGLIWCAWRPAGSYSLFLAIAAFHVGHALVHIGEMLTGLLPHSHWWIDAPTVLVPALFLGWLAIPSQWQRRVTGSP